MARSFFTFLSIISLSWMLAGCPSDEPELDAGTELQDDGGEVELAGPEIGDAVSCRILAPTGVIHQGETMELEAVAYDSNEYKVPGVTFGWASSNEDAVTVNTSGVASGGTTTGSANITATAGDIDCTEAFYNYADATGMRVVVLNQITGQPVSGAAVVVNDLRDDTDSNGHATVEETVDAQNPATVSVFHEA